MTLERLVPRRGGGAAGRVGGAGQQGSDARGGWVAGRGDGGVAGC